MEPGTGEVFAKGSLRALRDHAWFGTKATVLYFGDSYSSDVAAARHAGIDAVLVLEELADDVELLGKDREALQTELQNLGFTVALGKEVEECCEGGYFSRSQWGSFFLERTEGGTVRLNYWAALAQEVGSSVISSIDDIVHT